MKRLPMSRKQAIKEVMRMKAINQLLSTELAEKDAEIDRLIDTRSVAMRKTIRHQTEENRLRKALEETEQAVLYSDVSSAETLHVVYGIVNNALEPKEA